MYKIDWVRKLTSRKLWMAVVGFVTGLLIYLGQSAEQAEKLGALILSAASVLAYILGEGLADSSGGWIEVPAEDEPEDEPAPVPYVPPSDDADDGK